MAVRWARIAGVAGWPLFIVSLALALLAPVIQARYFPIRVDQSVKVIERTASRLCWTWTATKVRPGFSDHIDVRIDSPLISGAVGAIYRKADGMPWGIPSASVPPDHKPHSYDFCSPLGPYIRPTDPVRIRQTAYYPGALGLLWLVPSRFPDVVDPPESVFPAD